MSAKGMLNLSDHIRTFGCDNIPVSRLPTWDEKAEKIKWGGKGAGLRRMSDYLGFPVPPGFSISTEICAYYTNNTSYPSGFEDAVLRALSKVEQKVGRGFGVTNALPLLVSVRSGARQSMPGMMDTILNIGLNDKTVDALRKATENDRFALDCYRRLIRMYGETVYNIPKHLFDEALKRIMEVKGATDEKDLDTEDFQKAVAAFKAICLDNDTPFPQSAHDQLMGAIGAVFGSWMCERAIHYREIENIPSDWGTAVNVQVMVFGNLNNNSATCVAFTRDSTTGEDGLNGDFLIRGQGEDVVAGTHKTDAISERDRKSRNLSGPSFETWKPEIFAQLQEIGKHLEQVFHNMQDLEATIEDGKLWLLQCRNGKRSAAADVRIAVDLANEGLITREEAVEMVNASNLDKILHPTIDPSVAKKQKLIGTGLPGSVGAASGIVALSPEEVERIKTADSSANVILVAEETMAEYVKAMQQSTGVLTVRGGLVSHAAVVMRGWGKPAVVGMESLTIDLHDHTISGNGFIVREGETITIDGSVGNVYVGTVSTKPAEPTPELNVLLSWADEFARMKVRANADNGPDANKARSFGAVGIGLLRVEHTVLTDELLLLNFRRMILTHDADLRRKAMNAMQPILRDHLAQVFEEMQGLPVTIRLLDPPLHEFLPQSQEDIAKFSIESGIGVGVIKDRLHALHEHNPMLGYRGVRLAIIQPEIVEMQARAIFEAAIKARYSQSKTLLEIMVPLVSFKSELDWATRIIDSTYSTMLLEGSPEVLYMTGSMIELPGACVNAAELATSARFFSFGTNDLTQTTLGISRDDGGRFLPTYLEHELMDEDPFVSINSCVAKLMDLACASAPDLKKGVCGEHGGDPVSAAVFEKLGLDYVSCSPYRVPAARLAVAQAAIAKRKKSAHSDA